LCNRHLISNPACTAISIQTVLPEVLRRVQLCSGRALSWCARRETEPLRGLSGVFRFPKISRLLFIDIDPLPRRLTYDIFSVLAQLVNQSTTQKKCADKDQEVLLDTSKTDLYKQYLQDLEVRPDPNFHKFVPSICDSKCCTGDPVNLHRIPSLVIAFHLRTQNFPIGVRLCSVFACFLCLSVRRLLSVLIPRRASNSLYDSFCSGSITQKFGLLKTSVGL
jgi:hypothetical protein